MARRQPFKQPRVISTRQIAPGIPKTPGATRFKISRRVARAAGRPELGGRVFSRVREGGTTSYKSGRGDLSISRSLLGRVERVAKGLEVSPQQKWADRVKRIQADYKLNYREARQQATDEYREARANYVDLYMLNHPEASRNQAEKAIREAERTLRQPKSQQTDAERTKALRSLGQIGDDDYYRDGKLQVGLAEAG